MSKFTIKSLPIIITDQIRKPIKNVVTAIYFSQALFSVTSKIHLPCIGFNVICNDAKRFPKKGTPSFLLFALSNPCKKVAAADLTQRART